VVVTTNLIPWTITVHMFLSIVIIALQLYLIRLFSPTQRENISVQPWIFWFIAFTFIISIAQMFLGTQVRESIDWMNKAGINRENWSDNFSLTFLIHRSFSWLVLLLISFIFWFNRKHQNIALLNYTFYFLLIELIAGVILSYFNVPKIVQTSHLMFATFLIATLFLCMYRMKMIKPH
jgi:cytochrome c oxidase assembly protein subunit 15